MATIEKVRHERAFNSPQGKNEDPRSYIDKKLYSGEALGKDVRAIVESIELHMLPEYATMLGTREFHSVQEIEQAIKKARAKLDYQSFDKEKAEDTERLKDDVSRLRRQLREQHQAAPKQARTPEDQQLVTAAEGRVTSAATVEPLNTYGTICDVNTSPSHSLCKGVHPRQPSNLTDCLANDHPGQAVSLRGMTPRIGLTGARAWAQQEVNDHRLTEESKQIK